MGAHLISGQFQSDKYPGCPAGKVPLSVEDPSAQPLLWEYAQRRRSVDAEFSADLETALFAAGYTPPPSSAILPPTGEPFATVGTAEARAAIEHFRLEAIDLADIESTDDDGHEIKRGLGIRAAILIDLLSHRDLLAAQVTELQQSNTRFTERARAAETDALHLAEVLDEFEGEEIAFLAEGTRTIVNRVLKAAGKDPRSAETRAVIGERRNCTVPEAFAAIVAFVTEPEPTGSPS